MKQDNALQVFVCGPKNDHECDTDGPELCGGSDWIEVANDENKMRASWGSVSCSKCGISAMEKSMWMDE